jgi:hypothetical protein
MGGRIRKITFLCHPGQKDSKTSILTSKLGMVTMLVIQDIQEMEVKGLHSKAGPRQNHKNLSEK